MLLPTVSCAPASRILPLKIPPPLVAELKANVQERTRTEPARFRTAPPSPVAVLRLTVQLSKLTAAVFAAFVTAPPVVAPLLLKVHSRKLATELLKSAPPVPA